MLDSRSRRPRFFGRSSGSDHPDSGDTAFVNSGEASTSMSVLPGRHSATKQGSLDEGGGVGASSGTGIGVRNSGRSKRSVDAGKAAERLSIFGGTFSSLGKSRKQALSGQSS